jgi:hypothetical protein
LNNTLERVLRKFNMNPEADYSKIVSPLNLHISRVDLAVMFGELGFKRGLELGVETGWYSRKLCQSIPGLKLYAVDAWQTYGTYRDHVNQAKLDRFYEKAVERLIPYDAEVIKGFSMDVVKQFEPESLDFVYIDSNHRSPWVNDDIREWSKIVRSGGCVAGHDYTLRENKHNPIDVIAAVKEYTTAHNIQPYFTLTKDPEETPSWFWIKS